MKERMTKILRTAGNIASIIRLVIIVVEKMM